MTNVEFLTELNMMAATAAMNFTAMRTGKLSVQAKQIAGEVADAAMTLANTIENGESERVREAAKDEFIRAMGVAYIHADKHDVPELIGQVALTTNAMHGLNVAGGFEG